MRPVLHWLVKHAGGLLLLFFGVLLPLYAFGKLAEDILEQEIFRFDRPIQLAVHQFARPAFDIVMLTFSRLGSALVLLPLDLAVMVLLLRQPNRLRALFWVLATGGAALLNLLAKHTFQRVRPDLWLSLAPETTFSFPSGHAMQSMAVTLALLILVWHGRWRLPALLAGVVFVLLVGLSRVYLGVHFPSDILAGWSASLAWVIGLNALFMHLERPRPGR